MRQMITQAKAIKGWTYNLILKFKKRMNWFDISHNLDTSDCVNKELLCESIDSPNKQYMIRYVPTHFTQLQTALEQLIAFDKTVLNGTLVDFGCGKGRVLIVAERMGFNKVVGVEFSRKLYDICLRNLRKVKSSAVSVICADAVDYPLSGDMKTFYFCNPFEYCIFENVLKNIKQLLKTVSSPGYIVYIDPRQFGRLDAHEYELIYQYEGPGTTFHIYKVLV